jgi:DNA-binding NarL/FixJ family response regulator
MNEQDYIDEIVSVEVNLTKTEKVFVKLFALGMSDEEISTISERSTKTIRRHRQRVLDKLNQSSKDSLHFNSAKLVYWANFSTYAPE